jgi:two-component SAPR family response regulator
VDKVKIRFDVKKQQLTLHVGDASYSQPITLNKSNCFKILFGSNDYLDFKTNDVPPMKLRNIQITEREKLTYSWLLNESSGTDAAEEINGSAASVVNPLWIKKLHLKWEPLQHFTVNGAASVAFNPATETLYIISTDSLQSYSVPLSKLKATKYSSGSQFLEQGNQSIFNDDKIYNINSDQKKVAVYNLRDSSWNLKHGNEFLISNSIHSNKFYSKADSSLYVIGGYGQFYYLNDVEQFSLKTGTSTRIKTDGTTLIPRYLAAIGATNKGAYILGGYGSSTGQQILNPKNLYDLNYFDARSHTFKKIYELNIKGEDFVFANSMVIDEKSKAYYALVFPKHKYNSRLQMISGSLTDPTFKALANQIPYTFHDIDSYADLFYCPVSKRFVAVTLFLEDKKRTKVSIYSLYSPPIANEDAPVNKSKAGNAYLWYIGIGLLALAGLYIIYVKKTKKGKATVTGPAATEQVPEIAVERNTAKAISHDEEPAPVKNAIYLFGDLQLFDNEGNDITKYLTPLTKELFLVIILYTIRWGRGITSEKLKEILWFDKSAESARNNRSVNIAKLKNVLDKMQSCQISKESGHWKIDMDDQYIKVDYKNYLDIVKDKRMLDKQKISDLARIIQRGNFLADVEYEWLDTFKSEISNEIIDTYLHFAGSININDDPEFLIKLANYIFYFDPVNEEAMALKCKSLIILGKHSIAKNAYDTFCREYKTIYGQDFEKSFNTIIE